MTDLNTITETSTDTAQRRAWVAPRVTRMKAGDAETGPNPDTSDGAFAFS